MLVVYLPIISNRCWINTTYGMQDCLRGYQVMHLQQDSQAVVWILLCPVCGMFCLYSTTPVEWSWTVVEEYMNIKRMVHGCDWTCMLYCISFVKRSNSNSLCYFCNTANNVKFFCALMSRTCFHLHCMALCRFWNFVLLYSFTTEYCFYWLISWHSGVIQNGLQLSS